MRGEQLVQNLCHKSGRFVKRNSANILTCVGAIGVVVTAVSAAKATPKALEDLDVARKEKGEDLTKFEVIKAATPAYIPTIVLGTATIACVFGANILNKQKQAAITSAYALLDSSYKEYRKKVKDLYGEEGVREIREGIAKDNYEDVVVVLDDEKLLFYDEFSQRYFESTMADVIKAEYEVNRTMINDGGVYLNEFYSLLDLPPIKSGNELGWSSGFLESNYWASWVEFDHTKVDMEDGMECYIITMRYEPMIDFYYY